MDRLGSIPDPVFYYTEEYREEWSPNGETEWHGYEIRMITREGIDALLTAEPADAPTATAEPTPEPTATPTVTPEPTPEPTATLAAAQPAATPTPLADAPWLIPVDAALSPANTPTPAEEPATASGSVWLLVLFGMVAAIAAALIVLWVKRRKR